MPPSFALLLPSDLSVISRADHPKQITSHGPASAARRSGHGNKWCGVKTTADPTQVAQGRVRLRVITFIKKSSCLPKSSVRRFLALFHSKHHFLLPLSYFKLQNFVLPEGFTISGFPHHFLLLLNACATSASVAPRSFLPRGSSPCSPSCHFRNCVCYFLAPPDNTEL